MKEVIAKFKPCCCIVKIIIFLGTWCSKKKKIGYFSDLHFWLEIKIV